jgi:hypothetical protein
MQFVTTLCERWRLLCNDFLENKTSEDEVTSFYLIFGDEQGVGKSHLLNHIRDRVTHAHITDKLRGQFRRIIPTGFSCVVQLESTSQLRLNEWGLVVNYIYIYIYI